ncbi:hypothetical protein PSTT_15614 [Puccinia striiformis]|uniref:Uncharacterized protein n=1 Tax=Puccinia striiformis TaxID=27350 RepID=A0A2S4UGP7_9BASI|nr:hypothetical protein PSTT_15614 [Puccinia striiformis]
MNLFLTDLNHLLGAVIPLKDRPDFNYANFQTRSSGFQPTQQSRIHRPQGDAQNFSRLEFHDPQAPHYPYASEPNQRYLERSCTNEPDQHYCERPYTCEHEQQYFEEEENPERYTEGFNDGGDIYGESVWTPPFIQVSQEDYISIVTHLYSPLLPYLAHEEPKAVLLHSATNGDFVPNYHNDPDEICDHTTVDDAINRPQFSSDPVSESSSNNSQEVSPEIVQPDQQEPKFDMANYSATDVDHWASPLSAKQFVHLCLMGSAAQNESSKQYEISHIDQPTQVSTQDNCSRSPQQSKQWSVTFNNQDEYINYKPGNIDHPNLHPFETGDEDQASYYTSDNSFCNGSESSDGLDHNDKADFDNLHNNDPVFDGNGGGGLDSYDDGGGYGDCDDGGGYGDGNDGGGYEDFDEGGGYEDFNDGGGYEVFDDGGCGLDYD